MDIGRGARKIARIALCTLLLAGPAPGQPASPEPRQAGGGATGMMPQPGTSPARPAMGGQAAMMAGSGSSTGGQGHMCPPQCGQMMEKEMRAYPWKMAGVATLGVIVGIAFILLIALEVQWLKLWSHRVRTERAAAPPPAGS